MLTKISTNIDVFAQNFLAAKKAYIVNSCMEASACAAAFIGQTEPVNIEDLKSAKHLLRHSTGILSLLGNGNASQVVAAVVAMDPNPEEALSRISDIHRALDKQFSNSDYLVLAAVIIYQHCKPDEYGSVVDRTRDIYMLLHSDHPIITGREDLANCALMAIAGFKPKVIAGRCEQDFQAIRKYFLQKNKVQFLACITSLFDGTSSEKAEAVELTRRILKEYGVRFDSSSFSIVAAIAMIVDKSDRSLVCGHIAEVSAKLKSIRGMGAMGVGKKIRNMIAAAIVIDAYADGKDVMAKNSAISAIVSAVIAAELAEICAVLTAGAALASASH
ncbi:MAG: DUF4003 family protein [Clostridiales bacterium]|nr:DUF4003 family protein [Clostridiales bacterium]